MKRGLITATAVINTIVLYQIVVKKKCIIHQANIDCVIAGYKQKCFLGSCETTFKDRLGNHKKLFNHLKHKSDTELSKEF